MKRDATIARGMTGRLVEQAAITRAGFGPSALLERAFAFAFRGLVYPQIWEDPVCDMLGLELRESDHLVTIASGGCNALSYLVAKPARITAIDLNSAHVALNRLKQVALQSLPDQEHFRRFFVDADRSDNIAAYHRWIAPGLDAASRRYWEGRDLLGRPRIAMFARGIYRYGLLGMFIGLAHGIARLHGTDPRRLLQARNLAEQRILFEALIAPLFDKPLIRWITGNPASLFGLGIPPAQYQKLAGEERMADVLRRRLRKLCCDFPLEENYFAWQALSRTYAKGPAASLPPYLEPGNYARMRDASGKVDVVQDNLTDWLARQEAQSVDKFLLLDAQDWMTDSQLNALWGQICRTAAPNARVLFRTAGEDSLLAGRLSPSLLAMWQYQPGRSRQLTGLDRSSIYGGVHLYLKHD